jgi:membrane associated rhomboid family serine protease
LAVTPARRREPIARIPGVVLALFVFMALAQIAQIFLSPDESLDVLAEFAFVPARLTAVVDAHGLAAAVRVLHGPDREAAQFFLGGGVRPWSVLTYAFIHAGWAHLLANSIWLAAFGAPVARRIGALRFLTLFCIASIGGAAAHWLAHPFGVDPVVGASAGISGVMAAAARFVFQPGGPIGPPLAEETAREPEALSVIGCFRDRRALAFILVWFVVNFVVGVASGQLGVGGSPIAWEAHIGGFFVGLALFSLLDRRLPPATEEAPAEPAEPAGG